MILMLGFGVWCSKEGLEVKHFSVEGIREWAERCKEGCGRFALQREGKALILIFLIVAARSGMNYLRSFSSKGSAMEKKMLKEMATKN